jgi:hypothetical protein
MVGAEFLAAAGAGGGGGFYYEVEVLAAKGYLYVGLVGTNLGPKCAVVGNDACSWGYGMDNGKEGHGCAIGTESPPGVAKGAEARRWLRLRLRARVRVGYQDEACSRFDAIRTKFRGS